MKYKLIICLVAFFSFQIGEVKSENTVVATCLDCPNVVYMQGTSLMLSFPQLPSWHSLAFVLPTYYFDGNGNSYGPLIVQPNTISASVNLFEIKNFPTQALPIDGNFVFAGGIVSCRYGLVNEVTKFLGCDVLDEACGCPALDFSSTGIGLSYKPLEPNIPYSTSDDLELIVKWGTNNVVGPVTATHTNTYYWAANLPDGQNPCCSPFTGEIIINSDKVCVYENHFLIDCHNDPNPFSTACEDLGGCQEHLSDLIRNIAGSGCPHFKSACDETSFLYRLGKVEIGTVLGPVGGDGQPSYPNGYNLSVDGSIVTDFIKVELCGTSGWCDYVFEPTYNLMSLNEVRSFVSKNGHLPSMPSEKDIKTEGGIKTKEIMLAQQEKVEEIYLYLIEMDEQINQLQQKVNILKVENSLLSQNIK